MFTSIMKNQEKIEYSIHSSTLKWSMAKLSSEYLIVTIWF